VPLLASDPARDEQLRRLRDAYPVFRVEAADAIADGGTVQVTFTFTAGGRTFRPSVEFSGLRPDEAARATDPAAQRIVRALAIVEAASYWKATVSPVIEIGIGASDLAEVAWWEKFWIPAMGEFLYRNGVDFTAPGFLRIATAPGLPAGEPTAPGGQVSAARPLVMFSGGKDSLALTHALKDGPVDFFLYNPTQSQRTLARSLAGGGRITEVHRSVLPELLAMNDSGEFLNGHTPYSAYLALAAMLIGYLQGNDVIVAGNSRSDDEPNVSEYLGRPVNHQWTKSAEYEQALQEYAARWLPGAPSYCSPLRPLYELQIIRSLAPHMDEYFQTQSCNKLKGRGWCLRCAKCAWVFLATTALFGRETAIAKAGDDMLTNPELSGLYLAMAGLNGDKPFECTGTETEVRSAIVAAAQQGSGLSALEACLRDPAVLGTRALEAVLKDWGLDHLMPVGLRERVRQA
jgi:UDP-N-acetyl-alpha-D-muramoyl-L-alanyl-L-glutamate epimerase